MVEIGVSSRTSRASLGCGCGCVVCTAAGRTSPALATPETQPNPPLIASAPLPCGFSFIWLGFKNRAFKFKLLNFSLRASPHRRAELPSRSAAPCRSSPRRRVGAPAAEPSRRAGHRTEPIRPTDHLCRSAHHSPQNNLESLGRRRRHRRVVEPRAADERARTNSSRKKRKQTNT